MQVLEEVYDTKSILEGDETCFKPQETLKVAILTMFGPRSLDKAALPCLVTFHGLNCGTWHATGVSKVRDISQPL